MDGVGEALGRTLPDDGEDLLEVGLVQLLLEEEHVLVEVSYEAVDVAAAVREEGAALEQELLYHRRHPLADDVQHLEDLVFDVLDGVDDEGG